MCKIMIVQYTKLGYIMDLYPTEAIRIEATYITMSIKALLGYKPVISQ